MYKCVLWRVHVCVITVSVGVLGASILCVYVRALCELLCACVCVVYLCVVKFMVKFLGSSATSSP